MPLIRESRIASGVNFFKKTVAKTTGIEAFENYFGYQPEDHNRLSDFAIGFLAAGLQVAMPAFIGSLRFIDSPDFQIKRQQHKASLTIIATALAISALGIDIASTVALINGNENLALKSLLKLGINESANTIIDGTQMIASSPRLYNWRERRSQHQRELRRIRRMLS